MNNLLTGANCQVVLGTEVGRGGEGVVYRVAGDHSLAAKVYFKAIEGEHQRKLSAMAKAVNNEIISVSSWPTETLHRKESGELVGFLMPYFSGYKPVHSLFGPKSRKADFPGKNWDFLIHAASNVARAFSVLHSQQFVVGDVNGTNVLVAKDATVKFVDCDSFQIRSGSTVFLCNVGRPDYQPPELQFKDTLRDFVRTPYQDSFGLSVLIFQLLFMGRHPFSGLYLGHGDMPIEKAIHEYRYAYSGNNAVTLMKPPTGSLPVEAVTPSVASLFERAFADHGTNYSLRPSAAEWVQALDGLKKELKKCNHNRAHIHYRYRIACPWCEMEAIAGVDFFGFIAASVTGQTPSFQINDIWEEICKVKIPARGAGLPTQGSYKAQPSEKAVQYRKAKDRNQSIGVILILVFGILALVLHLEGFGFLWAAIPYALCYSRLINTEVYSVEKEIRERWTQCQTQSARLLSQWDDPVLDRAYNETFKQLLHARNMYCDLARLRQEKIRNLESNLRKHQLSLHLDKYRIQNATIAGVGPVRKATLLSYQVETAADIDPVTIGNIPGFGPTITGNLVKWRKDREKSFVFNPKRGVDQSDIAKVDRDINNIATSCQSTLTTGLVKLQQIVKQYEAYQNQLKPEIDKSMQELAQAEADYQLL